MHIGGIGTCWYTVHVAVRFLIDQEEYDEDTDSRVLAAKAHGLTVWGVRPRATAEDPDVDEDKLIQFVGKQLALIGDGGADVARISPDELQRAIDETKELLRKAKIKGKVAVWVNCEIDLGD